MQNLNYELVKTTSNYRQNPVLAFLFFGHQVRLKKNFNALTFTERHEFMLPAAGLDYLWWPERLSGRRSARHEDPIYDTTGQGDGGADDQCHVKAADGNGLPSNKGSERDS
jgi:hypothetical protein